MPYYPERNPGAEESRGRGKRGRRRERGSREEMRASEAGSSGKSPEDRKRRGPLWTVILILSAAAVLYGGFRLGDYGMNLILSRRVSSELREIDREATSPEGRHTETAGEEKSPDGRNPSPGENDISAGKTGSAAGPEAKAEDVPPDARTVEDNRNSGSGETEEATSGTESLIGPDGLLTAVRYPDNDPPMLRERFAKLRRKSPYIVGWLQAGDIVDEAVVQKDNDFFLTRDATGHSNYNGALFLDEDITLRTRPFSLVIYGHNMKSGAMFGELSRFENSAYFYRHRILTLDTIYEDGRYVAFAAGEIRVVPGEGNSLDFDALFSSDAQRRARVIRQLEMASACGNVTDVQPEDQLLILLTCNDDSDRRTFVAARRLRNGESEDSPQVKHGTP